ncbi:dipeptidase [Terrilactibacillus laevilacticus]|uniref:dipeptidase n=1 Tax=Terrilactibacillus laevilacticus TaxID=1380157 RepID=UPI001146F8AA|nr:dipeptidase [Terrilactibacillus laevilacticus]
MTNSIKNYLKDHRSVHLDQLKDFLSIPSISAQSEHANDIKTAAKWLSNSLKEAGLENIQIMETKRHPVIYADWLHADGKPTVLIYGHYDVQPVDPLNKWHSEPFKPVIKDNKIFARGASDDKGQVFMHIKMVEAILKTNGELPVNVKFCIEGEEEIGSPNLYGFVENHQELLSSDVLLVSDTTMVGKNKPTVCYGLRGMCAFEIELKGPSHDLHSGIYGGAVQNPLHALTELLSTMHNNKGQVTVDGFYDAVQPISEEEMKTCMELSQDEDLKTQLELDALYGEEGYPTLARIWARPTLEINGLYGGFEGEGIKTVIPSEAHAKITCRLVPDQEPKEIAALLQKHLESHLPTGVKLAITWHDQAKPFLTPYDHPAIEAAGDALKSSYGVDPVYARMGGSVPIVELFNTTLGLPAVLMGFGLDEENFHAPNEHFHLENFDKGLESLVDFLFNVKEKLY